MKAIWDDVVVAESDDVVQIDEEYFFPLSALKPQYLRLSSDQAVLPTGRQASCFSLKRGNRTSRNAVWYFDHPNCAPRDIFGRVVFRNDVRIA